MYFAVNVGIEWSKTMFESLFSKFKSNSVGKSNFSQEAYDAYNEKRVNEFTSMYDLNSVKGISSIPVSEAKRYPDGGKSVVYMPEQILNRKATEYKKEKQYDLAIACLQKANELYSLSYYSYTRDDYERLVNILVEAGEYNKAKEVHKKLDIQVGTYVSMLKQLMKSSCKSEKERKIYQEQHIDKRIKEDRDREQYYFLLENYPAIAPKSFNGYRKMKGANTETYTRIIETLKNDGINLEKVNFWL